MIIAVASGKGGTGKTTVASNLALSLNNVQLLDCDVEEPNAHIFIKPKFKDEEQVDVFIPIIKDDKCTRCGTCVEACEFNALAKTKDTILFFPTLCMNCEACYELCPENAIDRGSKNVGKVRSGDTKEGIYFVDGLLKVGEPRGIPVIEIIKSKINNDKIVILDAPPGNSCPVIETVVDSDFVILVTEPTPFGLWDLRIAVKIVQSFNIPLGVIINRYGLSDNESSVEEFCKQENIPILMKIPFDRKIAEAYSRGINLVEMDKSWKRKFEELFIKIKEFAEKDD